MATGRPSSPSLTWRYLDADFARRSLVDHAKRRRTGPLLELRDHVLPEHLDRLHDLVVLELAELDVADDGVAADGLVALEFLEALLGLADDDHVLLVEELGIRLACLDVAQPREDLLDLLLRQVGGKSR